MYSIGSGDVNVLIAKNKTTKTYKGFIEKFFGITTIIYNAYASPIDHFRVGQILEDRYYEYLSDDWYTQVKTTNEDCPVLVSTLDFARLEQGKVVEFEECKTINFLDFIAIGEDYDIKKKKRPAYNQVQHQLYTSKLDFCTVVFICVYDYDDEHNRNRVIEDKDIKKFEVYRDEEVITQILEQAQPFNQFKLLSRR
jgi:hypothetical protein